MSLRRTALQRRTEMRRTPLQRKSPMRRQAVQLRAKVTKVRADTGPSRDQRLTVMDRAFGCCEICGRLVYDLQVRRAVAPYSIHHRQPRGQGGTRRPEINSPANLLLLCGDATSPHGCHAHVESNRSVAYDNGWLVRSGMDPATEPVLLEGGDLYLLTDDGCRRAA